MKFERGEEVNTLSIDAKEGDSCQNCNGKLILTGYGAGVYLQCPTGEMSHPYRKANEKELEVFKKRRREIYKW